MTFKLPKRLLGLLENEGYFGWKKKDFYVAAVKSMISCEEGTMHPTDLAEFKKKYGKDVGAIYIKKTSSLT